MHVIDRCKNFFKLSNGEWVSPENVEARLVGECRQVRQLFVHGDSAHERVIAVAVPTDRDATAEGVQTALAAAGSALRHFEVPALVHLWPDGFTEENGLLTQTAKLCRWKLRQRFAAELSSLFLRDVAARAKRAESEAGSLLAMVARGLVADAATNDADRAAWAALEWTSLA